jgi:hypothetical protein
MNFSEASPIVQSAQPALELISLARLSPELARQNLRASLLANPNYFDRITANSFKAVLNIQEDTTFESIGSIVYNPRFEQLQATINIYQSRGYSGASCKYGSKEYVRLYLSYDRGTTWQDQGMRAVNVLDTPGPKPLQYIVSAGISPAQTFCFMQNLPLARGILSWNTPPPEDSPDWTPVWGNAMDAQIQFAEHSVVLPSQLVNETILGLPEEKTKSKYLKQVIDTLQYKALRTADLYEPYSGPPVLPQSFVGSSIAEHTASALLASGPMALACQIGLQPLLLPLL